MNTKVKTLNKHLILSSYVTKNIEIKNAMQVKKVSFECENLTLKLEEADP